MSLGNLLFTSLMLLGPVVSISSSNWLICWVGIELSFLGLIPLMMSDSSYYSLSKESTMKYFCVQAAGSGVLLLGGILMYVFPFSWGFISSEIIFAFGLMVKLGVFPAHFWVPSVVSGLGWIPMTLMLTWQKVPPLFLLTNMVENSGSMLSQVLLLLGGFSSLVGALIGLNQTMLGPMLGASSISHSGWALLGVVYGGVWVYFSIYCLSFIVLMSFLWAEQPLFSGIMVLSLSGLPPFAMFIGKWAVLKSALGLGFSYWFLVLPLLGSVMSLFFYLKFFYSFYLEQGLVSISKLGLFISVSILAFVGVSFVWVM